MTSPPDVQNVPDVWGLLEQARKDIFEWWAGRGSVDKSNELFLHIDTAIAQRDRFVLVPKEADSKMIEAAKRVFHPAAAPKSEGK